VERSRFPGSAGVESVVEERDQRAAPIPAHGDGTFPTAGPLHLVRREVEGVDLRFGQVMPARNVALLPRLWKPRRRFDHLLLPRPGNDGTQVLAGLIGCTPRIGSWLLNRTLIDPVQEVANVLAA